jgi:hypothetical protein
MRVKFERLKHPQFGPSRTFPEGKIDPSDEGEVVIGVAADRAHGSVVINFGTPVRWIALGPDQARELAQFLIARADELSARPQ